MLKEEGVHGDRIIWESRIAPFSVASKVVEFLSRRSLRNLRSHGFYRLFVSEAIWVIIPVNIPFWTKNALSPFQIISWLLLIVSLIDFEDKMRRNDSGAQSRTERSK